MRVCLHCHQASRLVKSLNPFLPLPSFHVQLDKLPLRAQAAAAFIRTRKNCSAGDWPQLAALLSAFCEANDAAPGCSDAGQSCDVACLVQLVEALPYTEHAALLVLKVSTGEIVCPNAHTVLPLAVAPSHV